MKKLFLLLPFVIASSMSHAQIGISINIGALPAWGPTGYDNAQFYYIPDADAYYDVAHRRFEYMQGGRWVSGAALPGQYRNLDLYHVHKVVINEPHPWMKDNVYRTQYAQYRGKHDQEAIRDRYDEKYFQNPGNRQHSQWTKQHGNPHNGHANGHDGHDSHDNGHH